MNRLLENGQLLESSCGSNFSYILAENSMFFSTEYKVMQNQASGSFLKCMKMLYNGKLQLLYLTKTMKPFSALIPSLDPDNFMTIVSNLFAAIIDVKHNGFLSCQNIDIAFDKIFVEPFTYKVSLVYVPTTIRLHNDDTEFENEIRTSLVKLINGVSSFSSAKTMQLISDLTNGVMRIEDIYARSMGTVPPIEKDKAKKNITKSGIMAAKIVTMNAPIRVEIAISKDSFIIGKNASSVDGVISFNKMISRVHCRIDLTDGEYSITDLQSANGTYVNRVRLQPNQTQTLKNGDVIRLANSDFQFVIG